MRVDDFMHFLSSMKPEDEVVVLMGPNDYRSADINAMHLQKVGDGRYEEYETGAQKPRMGVVVGFHLFE